MSSTFSGPRTAGLSVVIPILNERDNLVPLLQRLEVTLKSLLPYEVIIIDDHSTDGSWEILPKLSKAHPIRAFRKDGPPGKAESLHQGFLAARYDKIAFIDADLQYPPEALRPMLQKLKDADIVISKRATWQGISWQRRSSSRIFHLLTARLLFQLPYDTQAGLKIFRATVLPIALKPAASWNFDIPFLWRATKAHYQIVVHPIRFTSRAAGQSKVNILQAGWQMIRCSVQLRWNSAGNDS